MDEDAERMRCDDYQEQNIKNKKYNKKIKK